MGNLHGQEKRKGKRIKKERVRSNAIYDVNVIFERFCTAKLAEGRAENTIQKIRYIYRTLRLFLDTNNLTADIRQIDAGLIRDYAKWLLEDYIMYEESKFKPSYAKKKGLSKRSVHDYMRNLRTFFKFCVDEDLIETSPFEKIKNVKFEEKDITILSVSELKALLNAPDKRSYSGFRDYVLMMLLIDSMMRINEALSITLKDIDFTMNTVMIRSEIAKNRKSRIVPLQKQTMKLLAELIEEVVDFDTEYIFLSNYGEPMMPNHFRNQLRRYHVPTAGITKKVHPHLFRHTGATMFLEAGGDIRHLQMILGHSDLRMVMRYTHLSNTSLKAQHEAFSPLNQVIGKLNKERKIKRR